MACPPIWSGSDAGRSWQNPQWPRAAELELAAQLPPCPQAERGAVGGPVDVPVGEVGGDERAAEGDVDPLGEPLQRRRDLGEVVPRRVLVGGGGDAGGCLAAGAVPAAAQRARLPQVGAGRWQGGGEQVGAVDPGHACGVPCADAEGGPGGGPAGGADERGHRYSSRVWWQ